MTQINQPVNPAVPDAYILNTPPAPVISGVPTTLVAVVGTGSWGPVNAPTPISRANCAQVFGPMKTGANDLGTYVETAALAGAQTFIGVRVTDTTDAAASAYLGMVATPTKVAGGATFAANDTVTFSNGAVITVDTVTSGAITTFHVTTQPTATTSGTLSQTATSGSGTGATFSFTYAYGAQVTSKYTGSLANSDTVTLAAGSSASTTKVTIARPNLTPEIYDNISGAGAAFWTNLVAAINSGQSGVRGPSAFMVATAGSSTGSPTNGVSTLSGGTDGNTTITAAVLIGADTGSRTGMYALRGIGPAVVVLAGVTDDTTVTTQIALALTEGLYFMASGAAGEYTNLTTAATAVASAGFVGPNGYGVKRLLGDWCYFLDTVNGGVPRMVSPQGFAAGILASLLPFESGLNKQIDGLRGTQKSMANQKYSTADLTVIGGAGMDVICNPVPGGNYFGMRFGKNACNNAAINGDNYSRMIPYLEGSFAQVVGQFVGKVITKDQASDAVACATDFLAGLASAKPQPWISAPDGSQPYSVQIDLSRAATGYEILNVKVRLGPILLLFVLNLAAGQTVRIDLINS